jgi:hypothetical protein
MVTFMATAPSAQGIAIEGATNLMNGTKLGRHIRRK